MITTTRQWEWPPPNKRFDYTQEPTRKGPKIQIHLRDGTQATVRTWDNVNHRWRFTPVRKKYYAQAKDHYVVTFPTKVVIVRISGSTYEDRSVLKSTAVSLGKIAISSLVPDEQQLEEVKRQTAEFIAALPRDKDNNKVLVDGGRIRTSTSRWTKRWTRRPERPGRLSTTRN